MLNYLYLFIITIAEATIGVFVKLVGDNVPIFTLNFYRVLFALFFILLVVPFFDKRFWTISRDDLRPVLVIGALIALQISLFNIAMTLAPIANVVIFWSVSPFFVFIFSAYFLKEKVQKGHILVFMVAFAGLLIAKPLSGGYALGNLIALFDGAVYAALITYMRYEEKTDVRNQVFWYMLVATVILSPAILIFGPGNTGGAIFYPGLGFAVPVLAWVACLGMLSTGVAYVFITLVLKRIKAAVYSLVDIIVSPVAAGLFGYFLFNEVPSRHTAIGASLLLLSGFVLTAYMRDQQSHFIKKFIDTHLRRAKPDIIEDITENKIVK